MIPGYEIVVEGKYCVVLMSKKAKKTFLISPDAARARALRIMEELADNGPKDLIASQFPSEGRHPSGGENGANVLVSAVKSHQLRVYGGFVDLPPRAFVCLETAIKKQNKADQGQLQRVAKKLGALDGKGK
ncbi:hypothetical protein [uncultured Litoreibacter sp.]|uniref:hypothetical protein n=1 Tax=uncultured Litoreibacter sp. TaxID=1392394 RepID=UPI00260892A1|nr:hypothetical protein [uncultured Litoreibacter sp.]